MLTPSKCWTAFHIWESIHIGHDACGTLRRQGEKCHHWKNKPFLLYRSVWMLNLRWNSCTLWKEKLPASLLQGSTTCLTWLLSTHTLFKQCMNKTMSRREDFIVSLAHRLRTLEIWRPRQQKEPPIPVSAASNLFVGSVASNWNWQKCVSTVRTRNNN
jgi:hypothetical protein